MYLLKYLAIKIYCLVMSCIYPPKKISNHVTSSGVVGRERMGTAFPHKKLSGKGTREILSDSFIVAIKLTIFYCYQVRLQHSVHLKPCQNYRTSELAKY